MNSCVRNAAIFAVCLIASPVKALDGLEQLSVQEKVEIAAPAQKVWQRVIGFDGTDFWVPGVSKNVLISGSPNEAGAVRELFIGDASVEEELVSIDPAAMTLKYKIVKENVDLLPVTHYQSTISVVAKGDSASEVTWSGEFFRGFPESDPPPYLTDDAAVRGVTGLYQAGLGNLKKLMEAKSQ
ncbi:hypothetical protein A1OO_16245 [Enterovibrio norvegicus FF-33]|uniref:SRPBCC family protein n=1 Tax=Enterovibrio norvegicus TaxID=188144 RepID=UPI0002D4B5A1|nr:SRPBCC family protein [Enterovibrio norvegicus]OEE67302.1 hypothetical protein A1OO_16245 [Enterovibrio norvegicus FF-33]